MNEGIHIRTTVPLRNMINQLLPDDAPVTDAIGATGTLVEWSSTLKTSPPPKGYQLIRLDDGCYADLMPSEYEEIE